MKTFAQLFKSLKGSGKNGSDIMTFADALGRIITFA